MKMKHSHKSPCWRIVDTQPAPTSLFTGESLESKLTSNYKLPTVAGWKRIRDKS